MTIFLYKNKATSQFLGYHISTMCQTSQDEDRAKRYSCNSPETIEKQKAVILNNLKYTLSDEPKLFSEGIKEKYFTGLKFEDIELEHREVPDVEIKHRITAIINENGITKLDMPLEQGIIDIVKDIKEGARPREDKFE